MCSGACRAGPRFCFAAALLSCATTSIIYHSFSILSTTFLIFLKNFVFAAEWLWFREQKNETNHLEITSVHFIFLSGERGIWTLAPVLPTYSLSRGAPSASWVFLQKDTYQCGICNYITQRSVFSGEDGIRTHVPVRTNGFQDRLVMTASIPLRIGFSVRRFDFNISREQMIYYQKGYYVSMAFLKFFQPFFSPIFQPLFSVLVQRHFSTPFLNAISTFFYFFTSFSAFAFPMCSSILFPIPMVSYSGEKKSGGIKPAGMGLPELWIL